MECHFEMKFEESIEKSQILRRFTPSECTPNNFDIEYLDKSVCSA